MNRRGQTEPPREETSDCSSASDESDFVLELENDEEFTDDTSLESDSGPASPPPSLADELRELKQDVYSVKLQKETVRNIY